MTDALLSKSDTAAFATYRRVSWDDSRTVSLPATSRGAVLRPWHAPRSEEDLEPIDLVGERLLDAIIRIARQGSTEGIRLTGTVETGNYLLEAQVDAAARTGNTEQLEAWRGKRPLIKSFSAMVADEIQGTQVRVELRSDGVIFVYTDDRELALSAARRFLQCALGVEVEKLT